MAISWNDEEIQKLVQCQTSEEMQEAFPGSNVGSLSRRRREFIKAGYSTLDRPGDGVSSSSPSGWAAGVEVSGDSGTICSGPVEGPINDYANLLKIWNIDPEHFEVVEPVTFKAWDTPAKDEKTQQIITKRLYSYKARIQRKQQDRGIKLDLDSWREDLRSFSPWRDIMSRYVSTDDKLSYVICIADPQLGKPGTEEAVANWKRGIKQHVNKLGQWRNDLFISEIVIAFMGDEHEGAVGNYASQPYEIELNYTEQIQLDFDLRVWSIKTMLDSGLPVRVSSVPSNHGEHTRFGSAKVMTSIYDNSSTMVAGLVKKLFDETPHGEHITWHIAEKADNTLMLNGVKANFSHGHVAKGSGRGEQRTKSAIERQILGRTDELGDAQLWFTAHYHHYYCIEDRGRTMFGCPALEAEKSSDWFYSQYGVWSRPGMLGVLVGESLGPRGWAEANVL